MILNQIHLLRECFKFNFKTIRQTKQNYKYSHNVFIIHRNISEFKVILKVTRYIFFLCAL